MSMLTIRLFGRLSVQRDATHLSGLDVRKVQELLCYLLIHRDRPHARETLASLLWSDVSSAQSKAYLRKALWQLQASLADCEQETRFLLVDEDWVQFNPQADVWLDIAAFEQAFALVRGIPGETFDGTRFACVQRAVDLYHGDLLEGWYHEWCLFDRERLQRLHLAMLEKLVAYCEAHRDFEAGLTYGMRILRFDPAHERTHRRLMRLYYLSGDRTSALRQYERCHEILDRELGVDPDKSTLVLHQAIKNNRLEIPRPEAPSASPRVAPPAPASQPFADLLERLNHFRDVLDELQRQVQHDSLTVDRALHE